MSRSRLAPVSFLALVFVTSCLDIGSSGGPVSPGVEAQFVDGAHNGGNAHFYFLPPLVGAPAPTGAFDASVAPFTAVEICEWSGAACVQPPLARFTTTGGPGSETIRVELDQYVVDWHTDQFALGLDKTYRMRVLAAGTELGHADVDVVSQGKDLRNVETGEYVGLVDGRTLPIKFRIEQGAVYIVGPAGGSVTAAGGVVSLAIPPQALASVAGLTVQPAAAVPADSGLVEGTAYLLGPDSVRFATPAVLALGYDPARVPGSLPDTTLRLHSAGGDAWTEVFDSWSDAVLKTVAGSVDRLGVYGVLPARRIDTVLVSPDAATLDQGDTLSLRATPADAHGNPLNRPVTWASSDAGVAIVDPSGLVTAVASGHASITATSGGKSGTARLAVGNPDYPHEPPGFTTISERAFTGLEEAGWRNFTTSQLLSIVPDLTAPKSPPSVARALFPRDSAGGSELGMKNLVDFTPAGHRSLYLSFWIQFSPNWQGHDTHVNKIFFITADDELANPVTLSATGRDADPLHPEVRLQGTPIGARNLPPNVDPTRQIVRGQWHRWELLLVMNTGGNADGEVHWWLDNHKVGDYRDVIFVGESQRHTWDALKWVPVWGGVGDVVLNDMYQLMDHSYVSGQP